MNIMADVTLCSWRLILPLSPVWGLSESLVFLFCTPCALHQQLCSSSTGSCTYIFDPWTLHWGKKLRWCSMNAHQHQKKCHWGLRVFCHRGGSQILFFLFPGKTILSMLCLFKLVHPRMSPKLLSSSWRAFNLLGKQWSQIFFNVALILLGKHLFILGLTGSKWEVCMCPLTLQLTECEILGPRLLWTL